MSSEAAKKAWKTMRVKGIRRRSWWQMDPVVERYVKKDREKLKQASLRNADMVQSIRKLPLDFTCFQSKKKVSSKRGFIE